MIIKGNIETMARDINSAIQEYLEKENKSQTTSDEVIDFLIEKGLFEKVKKKKLKTEQFEYVLSEIIRIGREKLIQGMNCEKTKKKTIWTFDKV